MVRITDNITNENPNKVMWLTTLKVVGILLCMESVFMAVCSLASLFTNQAAAFQSTILSAVITFLVGLTIWIVFKKNKIVMDKRAGLLTVTFIWVIFSLFGSLPAYLGGYIPSFTDAFFETMSGFTTTGASILNDVEVLPYSIGLWRVVTEWIGGIGIVVIMLSIVSFSGGGGMSLFAAEVAGMDKHKIAPHIRSTAFALLIVYVAQTIVYFITYFVLGMNFFDAVCHALTSVSTSGLSSKNASAAAFSPAIQYAMIVFMFISGHNLLLIYSLFKGHFKNIWKQEEMKVYWAVIVIASLLIFALTYQSNVPFEQTARNSLFMTLSTITSAGLINCDISAWNVSAVLILLMLMNSGAMSGSTSGGLKLVRMIVLFKNARNTISKGIHSNAFIPVNINGKILPNETLYNVFNLFMLYIITLVVGALIIVATGVGIEESFVAGITSLCNMGPGFGDSAFGNFSHFSNVAKWVMAAMMCIGRLELVTVFALFSKQFLRR